MQLLKRRVGSENNQKKSMLTARFVAPLVLAFLVFGVVGLFGSGQASAHVIPSSTCGNVNVGGAAQMTGYTGETSGTVSLFENTCTSLYYAEGVCSTPETLTLDLFVDISGKSVSTYNTLNVTCTKAGQTFDTASHAYVQKSFFCADGFTPNGGGDSCIGLQYA